MVLKVDKNMKRAEREIQKLEYACGFNLEDTKQDRVLVIRSLGDNILVWHPIADEFVAKDNSNKSK